MSSKSEWPLVDKWIAEYKAHHDGIHPAADSFLQPAPIAQPSGFDYDALYGQPDSDDNEGVLESKPAVAGEEEESNQELALGPSLPEAIGNMAMAETTAGAQLDGFENLKARTAKLEAALADMKGKLFSSILKRSKMETLETHIKEAKSLLADMKEEHLKVAALHTKLQSVEAIQIRLAGLEGVTYDTKAEQDTLRQEVAIEVQTMQAAIAHLRKESSQLFEIDGNFYFTRPKAVAVVLALECILMDLES